MTVTLVRTPIDRLFKGGGPDSPRQTGQRTNRASEFGMNGPYGKV